MPTRIELEDSAVFKHIERRMMSKEDELLYRLKYGKSPKTRMAKESLHDNSRPADERAYINYYITNLEEDEN